MALFFPFVVSFCLYWISVFLETSGSTSEAQNWAPVFIAFWFLPSAALSFALTFAKGIY
jgi:hypothetical protein